MNSNFEGGDFRSVVFPAEIEEIRRRRREANDPRRLPEDAGETGPSADLDLTGLAFSGGGIRAASFSLGVTQFLIKRGLFKYVDFLSTVSGGGYTGSCLSALMAEGHGGEQLLVNREGVEEPPALNHLRNNSNFLVPGGLFNSVRMPSLFMVGVLQTFLLLLPLIIMLVFVTEVFFEVTEWMSLPVPSFMLALLGVAPLVLTVFLRPLRQLRRLNWEQRDRADRRAGACLVFAIFSLLALPVLGGLEFLIDNNSTAVFNSISNWLQNHIGLGYRSWLFWVGVVAATGFLVVAIRYRRTVLLWACGILAPLMLLTIFMFCCIYVVNSPQVNPQIVREYRAALSEYAASGDTTALDQIVGEILMRKQQRLEDYQIDYGAIDPDNIELTALKLDRVSLPENEWWNHSPILRRLTTRQSEQLTIELRPDRKSEAWIPELSIMRFRTEWDIYLAACLLWLFNYLFVNVNRTSLHPFYRDRLSRTFLIRGGDHGLESADSLRLSQLGGEHSAAPYHLVNTALNLQGSRDPQLRQRKTVPFLLAKRFSGSDYTSYCQTQQMEQVDNNLDLGTAMAISAAAAGPMMGAKTMRSLAFFLAMLNVRLAYWLPSPRRLQGETWSDWLLQRNPSLFSLLSEACGIVSDRGRFVNCSDGGHIENLGVYELLKRRCRTIICVDGGADPNFEFFDLTTLQRYASIDLDVRIEIDLEEILTNKQGVSNKHFAFGNITYHDGKQGTLIYLKLSYTGDEPEYIRFYKRKINSFPHESTADPFFDETRFEVYRELGFHVAAAALADAAKQSHLGAEIDKKS